MKSESTLKKILELLLIIALIVLSCLFVKYVIIFFDTKEKLTEDYIKNELIPIVRNIIIQNDFKNSFIILSKHGSYISSYYEKILCHPLFVECFLNTSLKEILLTLKEKGSIESSKTLERLLLTYINDPAKVVDDILTKTLDPDFKVKTKQDIIFLLKEYAKLLPMSIIRRELLTSQTFFDYFISKIDFNLYFETEDYLKNNMILLKRAYYNSVSSIKLNEAKIVKDSLMLLVELPLQLIACISKNMFDWFKEHLLLLDSTQVFFNKEHLVEFFRIVQIKFNMLEYAYPVLPNNTVITYADSYIFSPGVIVGFEEEFIKEKYDALSKNALGSFEITIEENNIIIRWGLFLIWRFKF